MNSFAKFQAKYQVKAGPSQPATGEKKATVPNATEKREIHDRILTVDIKTMRKHMRDEKNFNNNKTIMELFGELHPNFNTRLDVFYKDSTFDKNERY